MVHVAVIALLILVSFTVPQPDEDAGGVPVMLGNVESARGFDDPSLVDVDILPEEPEAPAPAETQPELPSEQDLLTPPVRAALAALARDRDKVFAKTEAPGDAECCIGRAAGHSNGSLPNRRAAVQTSSDPRLSITP